MVRNGFALLVLTVTTLSLSFAFTSLFVFYFYFIFLCVCGLLFAVGGVCVGGAVDLFRLRWWF
jgi:hypothetical protein